MEQNASPDRHLFLQGFAVVLLNLIFPKFPPAIIEVFIELVTRYTGQCLQHA